MRYLQDPDPLPELSPDLEWMLQSGQVSLNYLMQNLAKAYYEPVYQLSLVILGSREAALLAVQRIFLRLASYLHTYRSEMGVDAWLYRHAWNQLQQMEESERRWKNLEIALRMPGQFTGAPAWSQFIEEDRLICERLQALLAPERRAILLASLPGWGIERAAQLLNLPAPAVQAAVTRGLERIQQSSNDESFEKTHSRTTQVIHQLWASDPPPEYDEPFLLGKLEMHARRAKLFRQAYASLKEVGVLLIGLVLIGLLVWGGSRFFLGSGPLQIPEPSQLPAFPSQPTEILEERALKPMPTRTHQPSPSPTQAPTPTPTPSGVFYLATLGETLEDVAAQFEVSVEELRSLNRIAPEDRLARWQRLIIPGVLRSQPPKATPVTPLPSQATLAPPVTSDQVRHMLQLIHQPANTIWMDVLLVTGSSEQPQAPIKLSRMQLWFSRSQYLLITGPAGGWPTEIMLNNGGGVYVARPGKGNRWFERVSVRAFEEPIDITFLFGLSLLFSETEHLRGMRYELLGEGEIAGRSSWVVSQTSDLGGRRSFLWIDQQTGLLLRQRRLNSETVAEALDVPLPNDAIVMNMAVDVDFPQELFDTALPWRGNFARDHRGMPELDGAIFPAWGTGLAENSSSLLAASPLAQAASKNNRLSFRFPAPHAALQSSASFGTLLYLEDTLLTTLHLGMPWDLWCQRSADGDLVVFSQALTHLEDAPAASYGAHYLRLSQPSELRRPMPEPSQISSMFAISPDGEQIAFWACPAQRTDCGLYLHNTRTAENRKVIALSQGASNFVWSPDGAELGLLGANDSFFIVRLSDGEITYKGVYDREMRAIPPDSPTYAWGIKYPPLMTGLDGCVLPPVGDEQ